MALVSIADMMSFLIESQGFPLGVEVLRNVEMAGSLSVD